MHGTIIHYDRLTQCGLLRTEAGQLQYFRLDEVVSKGPVAAGQPVALRHGVLVDTGGSQLDASLPNPLAQRVATQLTPNRQTPAPNVPVNTSPERPGGGVVWVGGLLAIGALILLLMSGGQHTGYVRSTPKLIESTFGAAAAVLLVIEALLFFTSVGGSGRGGIRWTFWLIVWSSLFAYVGQTFDGFEADDATSWYAYALLTLGFAVYILPFRR
jgi:hypothetical protein